MGKYPQIIENQTILALKLLMVLGIPHVKIVPSYLEGTSIGYRFTESPKTRRFGSRPF